MNLTRNQQIAALVAGGLVVVGGVATGASLTSGPTPSPSQSPSAPPSPVTMTPLPASPSTSPSHRVGKATGLPVPEGVCVSHDGLPDEVCNPGSTDPRVTQDNIQQTICVPGYTAKVRPPVAETNRFKAMQMRAYGYTLSPRLYELDHLISLELGGAPLAEKNLWPQLWDGPTGAHTKDQLENKLHQDVCSGKVTLNEAQTAIATDWVAAYTKYVGPLPK